MSSQRLKTFYQEILVGVGFSSGLYSGIGIDPEQRVVEIIGLDPVLSPVLTAITAIVLLLALANSWKFGLHIGVISLFIAWLAGFVIVHNSGAGLLFLFVSVLIAFIASLVVDSRRNEYDLT